MVRFGKNVNKSIYLYKLNADVEDAKLNEFEVISSLGGTCSQVFLAKRDDNYFAIKVYNIDRMYRNEEINPEQLAIQF